MPSKTLIVNGFRTTIRTPSAPHAAALLGASYWRETLDAAYIVNRRLYVREGRLFRRTGGR